MKGYQLFFQDAKLFKATDVLNMPKNSLIDSAGCYAWFFNRQAIKQLICKNNNLPSSTIPLEYCYLRENYTLLYIGTSSAKDKKDGATPRSLRSRLKNHLRGNVACSTLRRSLGLLLGQKLVQHKSKFHLENEQELNDWLCENAMLCFANTDNPRTFEKALLENSIYFYPLNLKENPIVLKEGFEKEKQWLQNLASLRRTSKTSLN